MIKNLLIAGAVALSLALHISAAESGKYLFILSGQSNMERLDPNEAFLPAVTRKFGKDNVIVVKDAQGGQPILRWYKQWKPAANWVPLKPGGAPPKARGDLYDRLMAKVNTAIEGKPIKAITFVWMQGENDAKGKHGEVYAQSLQGLVAQLQKDLGRSDLNVVIGRISDYDMGDKVFSHWTMVRKAQVEFAASSKRYGWVDTDDLNGGGVNSGSLHYSVEGYKLLGQRFADKAIELISENPNKPDKVDGK
jgi:hypothetical protein